MKDIEGRKPCQNDDEIDLIELAVTLWKGRLLIFISIIFFFIVGVFYNEKIAQERYSVVTGYEINLHPQSFFKLCGNNKDYGECIDALVLGQYSAFLTGVSVNLKNSIISFDMNTKPESSAVYVSKLNKANDTLTLSYLKKANENLAIAEALPSDFKGTDVVADSVLQAKRMIYDIEKNDIKALTFKSTSIESKSKKVLVLIMSFLLGGMFGVFAVISKKLFRDFKTRRQC
jgi:uncharacterized protein YneF (UPF0154 family)